MHCAAEVAYVFAVLCKVLILYLFFLLRVKLEFVYHIDSSSSSDDQPLHVVTVALYCFFIFCFHYFFLFCVLLCKYFVFAISSLHASSEALKKSTLIAGLPFEPRLWNSSWYLSFHCIFFVWHDALYFNVCIRWIELLYTCFVHCRIKDMRSATCRTSPEHTTATRGTAHFSILVIIIIMC